MILQHDEIMLSVHAMCAIMPGRLSFKYSCFVTDSLENEHMNKTRKAGVAGLHLLMLRRLEVGDCFSYLGFVGSVYCAQSQIRKTCSTFKIKVERQVMSFTGYGIDLILVTRLA